MFYPKNVPNVERVLRVGLGAVFMMVAFMMVDTSLLAALILLVSAAIVIITGFIGWCPACAMVGRRIKQKQSNTHGQ